jgi:hypothetical protein
MVFISRKLADDSVSQTITRENRYEEYRANLCAIGRDFVVLWGSDRLGR